MAKAKKIYFELWASQNLGKNFCLLLLKKKKNSSLKNVFNKFKKKMLHTKNGLLIFSNKMIH